MSDDPIARLNTALEGRYHVERELGEGGMASVYVAVDLRHERKVALKVLKPELAAVLGAERFLTEIKTTANLQHPHILPLFDSGAADGYLYYVMPYIDGETLREKLDREKQLGVDEAVRIATDVADALDYAHRNDVIHRDIKPANILLHDGRPVVADFGIALAVSAAGGGRMTETGLSLGTPHYMSPEQASADRELSARSDVYSLGCVLYEMIAGQPPHTGPSAQSILVRILTKDPTPLTELRHTVPANVAAAVSRSIEKLPADRFETARGFMEALADQGFAYRGGPRDATAAPLGTSVSGGSLRPWIRDRRSAAAVSLAIGFAGLAGWGWLRPAPVTEPGVPTRVAMSDVTLAGTGGWRVGISPDGRWILKVEENSIHIRSSANPEWRRLPDTEGGRFPTFSPDGESVAFSLGGQAGSDGIWKVSIDGGPALPVAPSGVGPHWGLDGTIVYTDAGRLMSVSSSGGDPRVLLDSDSVRVRTPHLLPDGRAVVFSLSAGARMSRILIFEIETGDVRELVAAGNQPRYVPTGHLVYAHGEGALMGVPFDLETLEVTGAPVTLLPSLAVLGGGSSQFDVSESGTLIYAVGLGGGSTNSALVEWDLEGVETQLPVTAELFDYPRYSPDGGRIAYQDGPDILVYDVATGASPTFASGGSFPVWSANGEYIFFSQDDDIYRRRADFGEEAERVSDRPLHQRVMGVSPADDLAVVVERSAERGLDLLLMRQDADGTRFADLIATEWDEQSPSISPDGRWLAYTSNQSGENRIYVHSFPVPTGQYPISPGFGVNSRWAPDGRTLYYRSGAEFMAVEVTTEPAFRASPPRVLFEEPGGQWDVHPDGSRFVLTASREADTGGSERGVYLVTDWFTELRERMGEN